MIKCSIEKVSGKQNVAYLFTKIFKLRSKERYLKILDLS